MYVSDAAGALDAGDALPDAADRLHIDRVVFYGLGEILGDPAQETRLAEMVAALQRRGVTSIGAPIAARSRIVEVLAYSRSHPKARIDVLISELEYWRDCPADPAPDDATLRPCFEPMDGLLDEMRKAATDELTAGRPMSVGVYVGYPSPGEAKRIAEVADFVVANYNVRTPDRAHEGHRRRNRLAALVAAKLEVWPILYARGDVHMRPWLDAYGLDAAEAAFRATLDDPALPSPRLGGYQYFAFEAMAGTR